MRRWQFYALMAAVFTVPLVPKTILPLVIAPFIVMAIVAYLWNTK